MWYLLAFICCFLIDADKQKNPLIRGALIFLVITILCFGYMTGTDWRNYEHYFYNPNLGEHFTDREPGFTIFNRIAGQVISDFWIFSAICKIFYTYSLIHLIKRFSPYPWSVFALTLVISSLFLIVNCPLRFMLALGIYYFAFSYFLSKKYVIASVLSFISLTFHVTLIILILISCLGIFSDKIFKLKRKVLVILSIFCMFLSSQIWLYNFIFNALLGYIGLDMFQDSGYAIFSSGAVFTIGALWQFCMICLIIYFKAKFADIQYGKLIFTYSVAFFCLSVICLPIYSAFRITLFCSTFFCISIVFIVHQQLNLFIQTRYIRKIIYMFFGLLVIKTVYGSFVYYPYSNSIPYIISGHLPYNVRSQYNITEYSKFSGESVDMKRKIGDNTENL